MGVSQVFKIGSVEGLVRWLAPAIILLLPLLSLGMHWQAADLSGDREAEAYEARALEGVAPGALIMTQGDRATFWLWYGVYAERRRSDVAVVNAPLLSYRWYRDELRHRYPDLAIPEAAAGPTGLARATIEANIDRRPVYAADPPPEWREWFTLVADGESGLSTLR